MENCWKCIQIQANIDELNRQYAAALGAFHSSKDSIRPEQYATLRNDVEAARLDLKVELLRLQVHQRTHQTTIQVDQQ